MRFVYRVGWWQESWLFLIRSVYLVKVLHSEFDTLLFPSLKRCWSATINILTSFVQGAFTEEGLSRLWNELIKDGEMRTAGVSNKDEREDEKLITSRKSPFNNFVQEWTWGQVLTSLPLCFSVFLLFI